GESLIRRIEMLDRPDPRGSGRERGAISAVPARLVPPLVDADFAAPRRCRRGRAKPGGAGSEHDHLPRCRGGLERALAPAHVTSGCRIEDARDLHAPERAADAYVRADAPYRR